MSLKAVEWATYSCLPIAYFSELNRKSMYNVIQEIRTRVDPTLYRYENVFVNSEVDVNSSRFMHKLSIRLQFI